MTNLLVQSVVGASLVIAGVVIKNSMEQLKKPPSMIGPILFLLGWAIFGNAVARNVVNSSAGAPENLLPYVAAGLIAISVLIMKAKVDDLILIPVSMRVLQFGFVAGWLLLAFSIGRRRNVAFVSAIMVFAAMMFFLPKQRTLMVIDGPGMPLFTAAWAGMIYANAL